jgi:sulfite exporter TauE/SafE
MKGLLLGLASGANCLATCAPMLLSLLAAEAGGGQQRFGLMGFFLVGRAVAYSALGALAWGCGLAVQQWPAWHSLVLGVALMVCAVLLLRYGFSADPAERGHQGRLPPCVNRRSYRTPGLALAGGVVTGMNPCAPVLLAFAAAAQSRALFGAIFFFLCFFAGTSVYLLPLPLLGFMGRWNRARLVARFAVGLMGAYYLYSGLLLVIRGTQWSTA